MSTCYQGGDAITTFFLLLYFASNDRYLAQIISDAKVSTNYCKICFDSRSDDVISFCCNCTKTARHSVVHFQKRNAERCAGHAAEDSSNGHKSVGRRWTVWNECR